MCHHLVFDFSHPASRHVSTFCVIPFASHGLYTLRSLRVMERTIMNIIESRSANRDQRSAAISPHHNTD